MPAKKIMVIDDERDILKLIHGALRKYDHDVDIFSDPVKALGHFQHHRDGYSLLLVDVRMPGMSGFELYQELRKRDENVKVCFLTAFEMYRKEFNSTFPYLNEVKCFLKKLISMNDLVKRLVAILESS